MCDNRCCCCFSVKTGTLINLWITLIFWGIHEFHVIHEIFVSSLASSPTEISNVQQKEKDFTSVLLRNDSSSEIASTLIDTRPGTAILSAVFCTNGVILAVAIFGLFAVEKKKPLLLIPYFVYRSFWVFLISLLLIWLIFADGYLAVVGKQVNISWSKNLEDSLKLFINIVDEIITCAIVIVILILVLELHFATVVYKYYCQMEKEEEKEKNAIPMRATWSATNETCVNLAENGLNSQ